MIVLRAGHDGVPRRAPAPNRMFILCSVPALRHLRAMKSRLLLLPAFAFASLAQAASIWVEGEAPTKSNVVKHNWYDAVKRDVLSGGDWLSHYGEKPGEASYEIEVAEAGSYTFFARLNPVASEPRWRLDEGAWTAVTTGTAQQQQNIAGDGKPDHRFIAWVKIGALDLQRGSTRSRSVSRAAWRTVADSTASC